MKSNFHLMSYNFHTRIPFIRLVKWDFFFTDTITVFYILLLVPLKPDQNTCCRRYCNMTTRLYIFLTCNWIRLWQTIYSFSGIMSTRLKSYIVLLYMAWCCATGKFSIISGSTGNNSDTYICSSRITTKNIKNKIKKY